MMREHAEAFPAGEEPERGGFTLAEAGEALLPQLAELEQRCFSDPWTTEILRSQMKPGHVFLAAAEDGRVLGYAALAYVLDEGDITNVAVAPEARRRGIADALLGELETRARALGLAFLTLEVRESNAPARALYTRRGYRVVGRRRRYYEKPVEDAILMTLVLETGEGAEGQ